MMDLPRHSYLGQAATRLAVGLSFLLGVATAPAAEPPAATGAKIDESKVVKIYYVDPAGADAADDDKHGTQDSPFLTIKRAVDAAMRDKEAGIGAKIIIAPGTYREAVVVGRPLSAPDTDAPLVIEAAERDQTIIDAADTAGWESATWKTDGHVLVHPWPSGKTTAPAPRGRGTAERETVAGRRADLLFLNGSALRQVDAPPALVPGSFCIVPSADRKNPGAATVRVLPPADADDAEAGEARVFAVGVRAFAMGFTGVRNIVVRGLVFQHAADPTESYLAGSAFPEGLAFFACSNVLVEDVLSQWNASTGLAIGGASSAPWTAGITLRRVRLIHNGRVGLDVKDLKNLLAEDCETSFNNFRGEWQGTFDPQEPAGVRVRGIHGSTWRRHRAVGNESRGLWWTGDCTDLLVEDAVLRDNLFSGLLIENCPGPSVVRGCFVSGNKTLADSKPEASQPAGVSVEASPDVTLENNVIAGNFMPQLGLRDVAERTDGTDFETGAKTTLRAERHIYRHNVFWGADAGQALCDLPVSDRTGKSDFMFYFATLDSDENCFWNPASEAVFAVYEHKGARVKMPLAGWRSFLVNHAGPNATARPEAGSLWEDPQFMEPGEGDYRLQAQSPLIDWGLPSDEGAVSQ